jgi:RNA polymerase-binding transcription factor
MEGMDRRLAEKLDELDREMAVLTAPPEQTGDISFGKRVGDGTAIAVERLTQVATHERMLEVRGEVIRALAKLEEGTYGRCDRCGGAIPADRLDVLPWATAHVSCPS